MRIPTTDRQESSFFERVALVSASATVLIGVLGLLGWGFGLGALTSVLPNYIPVALSTCVALLVQGIILIVHSHWPSHARRWPFVVLVVVTAIFGMLVSLEHFAHLEMNFEGAMLPSGERLAQFPVNRMSPLTGMLVCSTGIALLLLLLHKNQKLTLHLTAGLASLVATVGLIGTVSYVYGTPLLYGSAIIPMALTTSVAFIFLGVGVIAAAGPNSFLIRPLMGGTVRAMLLRTFVPLGFIAVIGSDIFQHLVARFNDALTAGASAVLFGMATIVFVVQAAQMIEATLEKASAEREQAEQALREAHDRLNSIIEFLPDATFVIDVSGRVIAWNRAIEEMSGFLKAEMLQMADYEYAIPFYGVRRPVLIDLILKPEPEFESSKYNYIQRHGDFLYGETYAPRAFEGRGAYFWSTASVLRDSAGNVVGAIQSLRDITERKLAEEERLRLEQQLLRAKKAESLARMAGAIAHHFNNKLMVVMGNLELALGLLPQESPPRTKVLQAMQASHQAAEISRLMLTCIGQTAEKKESVDLAETIRETLPPLTASLLQNVHIKTEIPIQGPFILAVPVHVKQILTNLVLNASEAIGDREGDISVAICEMSSPRVGESRVFPPEWESKAEGYACLSVSDTGCGLDTEMLENIFDPFFSTKFTGRGLGLSVVLGLVRAYEGAIAVKSQVGHRTTFDVFFPLPAEGRPASQNDASFVSDEHPEN